MGERDAVRARFGRKAARERFNASAVCYAKLIEE
jgi:hypothetical protein